MLPNIRHVKPREINLVRLDPFLNVILNVNLTLMFYIIPLSCGHGKSRQYPVAIVDEKTKTNKIWWYLWLETP